MSAGRHSRIARGGAPRPLAEVVRATRLEAQPLTLLAAAQACWREAVGERIAAEAVPVSEREGVLTVACRAATWAEELDLLAEELLARLNAALVEGSVRGLRFTPSPPPR